jgi:hypothetical protein
MKKMKITVNQGLDPKPNLDAVTNPFLHSTAPMHIKKFLFETSLNIGKFSFSGKFIQISPKVAEKVAFFALKHAERIILTKMLWRVTLMVGFWVWTTIFILKMFLK